MRRVEPPLGDEAIGRRPAVQRAARHTVDVLFVLLDHHAQLREIEVRVERLEWIVGPLDELDAHLERALALREFQPEPEAAVARVARDAEHVRPLGQLAVPQRRDRVDEPLHHPGLVESAEQDAAALRRHDQDGGRDHVLGVGVAPDVPFEDGHLAAVLDRRQVTDDQSRLLNSRSE